MHSRSLLTFAPHFLMHSTVALPFEHSSGQYKGKSRVSNKANKKVKALFHNGAMSAIQHCTELKEYYQCEVGEGKNEMLVINNVCNKPTT